MEDYKKKINALKSHFTALANKQGCIYEKDYHTACYNITDARVLGEINVWLAGSSVPIRKQPPKSVSLLPKNVTNDGEDEYKQDVKNTVKHPNINKLKSKKAAESIKSDPSKNMPEVTKGVDKNKLNGIIDTLRDYEDEFLPAWKKFDEKKLAKSKRAQRISEEKRKLEDAIMAWNPPLSNADEWLNVVENAYDFPELQSIWDALYEFSENTTTRQTEEYVDFVDLDTGEEEEDIELDLGPTAKRKDPVEENIRKAAREEFSFQAKKKVKFGKNKFVAYVAESDVQKATGLEAFDRLGANESMLFPFAEPQHVTFHMGSVRFPIDIVFLMDTSIGMQAKKIVHNAEPGNRTRWAQNNVSAVLEFPGGTCKKLGIKLGSIIEVD